MADSFRLLPFGLRSDSGTLTEASQISLTGVGDHGNVQDAIAASGASLNLSGTSLELRDHSGNRLGDAIALPSGGGDGGGVSYTFLDTDFDVSNNVVSLDAGVVRETTTSTFVLAIDASAFNIGPNQQVSFTGRQRTPTFTGGGTRSFVGNLTFVGASESGYNPSVAYNILGGDGRTIANGTSDSLANKALRFSVTSNEEITLQVTITSNGGTSSADAVGLLGDIEIEGRLYAGIVALIDGRVDQAVHDEDSVIQGLRANVNRNITSIGAIQSITTQIDTIERFDESDPLEFYVGNASPTSSSTLVTSHDNTQATNIWLPLLDIRRGDLWARDSIGESNLEAANVTASATIDGVEWGRIQVSARGTITVVRRDLRNDVQYVRAKLDSETRDLLQAVEDNEEFISAFTRRDDSRFGGPFYIAPENLSDSLSEAIASDNLNEDEHFILDRLASTALVRGTEDISLVDDLEIGYIVQVNRDTTALSVHDGLSLDENVVVGVDTDAGGVVYRITENAVSWADRVLQLDLTLGGRPSPFQVLFAAGNESNRIVFYLDRRRNRFEVGRYANAVRQERHEITDISVPGNGGSYRFAIHVDTDQQADDRLNIAINGTAYHFRFTAALPTSGQFVVGSDLFAPQRLTHDPRLAIAGSTSQIHVQPRQVQPSSVAILLEDHDTHYITNILDLGDQNFPSSGAFGANRIIPNGDSTTWAINSASLRTRSGASNTFTFDNGKANVSSQFFDLFGRQVNRWELNSDLDLILEIEGTVEPLGNELGISHTGTGRAGSSGTIGADGWGGLGSRRADDQWGPVFEIVFNEIFHAVHTTPTLENDARNAIAYSVASNGASTTLTIPMSFTEGDQNTLEYGMFGVVGDGGHVRNNPQIHRVALLMERNSPLFGESVRGNVVGHFEEGDKFATALWSITTGTAIADIRTAMQTLTGQSIRSSFTNRDTQRLLIPSEIVDGAGSGSGLNEQEVKAAIADWAEEGNDEAIPAEKLVNAGQGAHPILVSRTPSVEQLNAAATASIGGNTALLVIANNQGANTIQGGTIRALIDGLGDQNGNMISRTAVPSSTVSLAAGTLARIYPNGELRIVSSPIPAGSVIVPAPGAGAADRRLVADAAGNLSWTT